MQGRLRKYYFALVKFGSIMGFTIWGMLNKMSTLKERNGVFLLGAIFLLFAILTELEEKRTRKTIWLIGTGLSSLATVILFPVVGIYFLCMSFLDWVQERNLYFYPVCYVSLFWADRCGMDKSSCFMIITFLLLLYFQHYQIIGWYRRTVGENLEMESRLKSDMEHNNLAYKNELNKSRLQHDNEMLEEKARISQALHDKLGHSINGSLYQLEAVKVLMTKKPQESEKILQEVIDNLRGSMDEIRVIIRNERPNKKKMALKALQALCAECEEQYQIKATLEAPEADKEIPEQIWEIILDNTFEAVTNSLKYSGCSEIHISILVLGEVVRATVKDNGKGCDNIVESMGIQGMKQRVRNVKGYFDIESEHGFCINMILPLTGKENKE